MTDKSRQLAGMAMASIALLAASVGTCAGNVVGYTHMHYDSQLNRVVGVGVTSASYDEQYYYDVKVSADLIGSNGFWAGAERSKPAALNLTAPAEPGVTYTLTTYHAVDIYFQYYQIDPQCPMGCYDWWDEYGYRFDACTPECRQDPHCFCVEVVAVPPTKTWYPPAIAGLAFVASLYLGSNEEQLTVCQPAVSAQSNFLPVGASVNLSASGCGNYQWSVVSGGGSVSPSGVYTAPNQPVSQVTVQATCTNCIAGTVQLTVFQIQLNKPEIGNKYKFNDSNPGQLTVEFEAQVNPDTAEVRGYLDGKTNFGIDPIGASQAQWSSAGGAAVYSNGAYRASVTFTNLPSNNSDFGLKEAWLTVGPWGRVVQRTGSNRLKIFYSAYATNHPGGSTPNYFYYYMQTPAAYGNPEYRASGSTTDPEPPFDYGVEAQQYASGMDILQPGANGGQRLSYVDLFAWACRHEATHHQYWYGWWVSGGYNLSQHDKDMGTWGDLLPDPLEPTMTANQGGPYSPTTIDSHPTDAYTVQNSQLPDSQRFACMVAPVWNLGSADSSDWAYPGKNWH